MDLAQHRIVSYQALVRGPQDEPASWVLDQVNDSNRSRFEQACRVKAVKLATEPGLELGLKVNLNINFFARAVYQPEVCIQSTLEAAKTCNFPTDRIVFEITEGEQVEEYRHLIDIVNEYHRLGFSSAIHQQPPRQAIVEGIVHSCGKLGIDLVAEGVEKIEEIRWPGKAGIRLFQGFCFARPAFRQLVAIEPAKYDQIQRLFNMPFSSLCSEPSDRVPEACKPRAG